MASTKWSDHMIEEFGSHGIQSIVRNNKFVNNYHISDGEMINNNAVIDMFLTIAQRNLHGQGRKYGLTFQSPIIRKGSSFEGLKIMKADEYDCLVPFNIEGARFTLIPKVYDIYGREIPGLVKMVISNHVNLRSQYPWLKNVLDEDGTIITSQLRSVFQSIVDSCIHSITNEMGAIYRVRRKEHGSGLQIIVDLVRDARVIDVDFIPGIALSSSDGIPRHVVMKWMGSSNAYIRPEDRGRTWRNSTHGYEYALIQRSLQINGGRFIWTACRIFKAYIKNLAREMPSSQVKGALKSYLIKNICLQLVLNKMSDIHNFEDALGHIIAAFEHALTKGRLLQFAHGNQRITPFFSSCPFLHDKELDLLENVSRETLRQAQREFASVHSHLRGLYNTPSAPLSF